MPRIARIVGIGNPHHIIQRGNNRQTIFFADGDRYRYLELLKESSIKYSCKIHAYCLMENHVHILSVPQYNYSFAKMMQQLSLRFTQYINKKYKRTGRLWECRFYSALVDEENYLWSVCRYIERNPARAKIVNIPCEYKWSSAKDNTMEEKSSLIEPICKSYIDMEEYIKFLNTPDKEDEIEMIKRSTFSGKPIGTREFITNIAKSLGIAINMRPKGRPRKLRK